MARRPSPAPSSPWVVNRSPVLEALEAAADGAILAPSVHNTQPWRIVLRPLAPTGAGVVVGVDGGPTTTEVLTAAAAQACVHSTSLLVVHCPRPPFADGSSGIGPSSPVGCQPLVQDVALLQQSLLSVPITLQVTDQDPVDGLVSAARTAELLVIGRRAPDGSSQVGSTGAVVTARAGAPVLVPAPSGQPSLDREWARRHAMVLAR